MNFYKLLESRARRHPEKKCVVSGDREYTYGGLLRVSREAANVLGSVRGGETVLIYSSDWMFQFTAFFALQAVGGVPVISHCPAPTGALWEIAERGGVAKILTEEGLSENGLRPMPAPAAACLGALTSGTTGPPKILFRSYDSWAGFFPVQNEVFAIDVDSVLFLHGSLSFTGNLNAALSALYAGGTCAVPASSSPARWRSQMAAQGVTNIYLVPAKIALLCRAQRLELQGVRLIFCGSQLLGADNVKRLRLLFPRAEVVLYYGSSELNYLTYLRSEDVLRKPLSVGKPFPGVELFPRDGLLFVRHGYQAEGIATPCELPDHGYLDADGELILGERKDDAVNINGFKVSLSKVERALLSMDFIDNAAALAYTNGKGRLSLAAFVCGTPDPARVKAALAESLLPPELPGRVFLIPALPLNSSGKPDRAALRERLERQRA